MLSIAACVWHRQVCLTRHNRLFSLGVNGTLGTDYRTDSRFGLRVAHPFLYVTPCPASKSRPHLSPLPLFGASFSAIKRNHTGRGTAGVGVESSSSGRHLHPAGVHRGVAHWQGSGLQGVILYFMMAWKSRTHTESVETSTIGPGI